MTNAFGIEPYELFSYQREDIDRFKEEKHKSGFFAYEPGLGKTITAVQLALELGLKSVLVVAPQITYDSWAATVARQSGGKEQLRWIRTTGKAEVAAMGDFFEHKPGFYFITWELMRNGSIFPKENEKQWVDMIVADEVHAIQNHGRSAQSIVLNRQPSEYRIALSGTPSANKPIGIFGVIHWLWPKRYKSLWNWQSKFWYTRRNGSIVDMVREINPGGVVRDLPFFIYRKKSDHRQDIPEPRPEVKVYVDMSPEQRVIYDKLSDTAGVWLGQELMVTEYSLVQVMRLRQIAIAVPKLVNDDEGNELVTFDLDARSSKMDALLKILDLPTNRGKAVLVYTHSAKAIPMIVHQLREAGISAESLSGETPKKTRTRLVAELGDTYQVLVGSIAAMGTGLDGLQYVCSRIVWMSKHASHDKNVQGAERTDRPGQKEHCQSWYILANESKDEDQLDSHEETEKKLAEMLDNKF